MNECVFCKIVTKEIPTDMVQEGNDFIAFRDIKPSAPVHVLVVPKIHITSVVTLEETHKALVANSIYAAKDIATKLGLKGYKLTFNVGREGGQFVDHLHLHLMGGWDKNVSR